MLARSDCSSSVSPGRGTASDYARSKKQCGRRTASAAVKTHMLYRPVAAVCTLLALTAFTGSGTVERAGPRQVVQPADVPYLRAAHWFDDGWPAGFWSGDLEKRAEADFAAIRDDGFNTIVLVVPWPVFAPLPTSGQLDASRVDQLRTLIRTARALGLRVVLRLSYPWDVSVTDATERSVALWSDPATYAGWLDHLDELWLAVRDEPNLEFGFFSWEDLWAVTGLAESALPARLRAAEDIGFRTWLQSRFSLGAIGAQYESTFTSWESVPLPGRREPGYGAFLEFLDVAWVERFYKPARERFPKLTMEVRIDSDPIWRGEDFLRWHSHAAAWDLPGAAWTALYWSPSMGGVNDGETVSPDEAARRLAQTLDAVRAVASPRPIFVSQLLVEDRTPGFERNGRLATGQVGAFLERAGPILADYTAGVALWAWRDYHHDAIGAPGRFNDLSGWRHQGEVTISSDGAQLGRAAWLERTVSIDQYHAGGGPAAAELCIEGRSVSQDPARIEVTDEEARRVLGHLMLPPERARVCLSVAKTALMRMRLSAGSAAVIRRVQSSGFVQDTGLRDLQGSRKPVAADYLAFNRGLISAADRLIPLFEDGWMGRHFAGVFERRASDLVLTVRSDLPANWPGRPQMFVFANRQPIGSFACGADPILAFDIPPAASPLVIRIEASSAHRVAGDARALGCHFSALSLEPRKVRRDVSR